ncbi:hypothetical protein VTJ83DRAFT_6255 [Remersonia thermophila]|uniref:F-box domain-containing protein n=1 Tax=Remersonia thermophila TaxID=72144 RepID=A0ABR4D540_9PEZI
MKASSSSLSSPPRAAAAGSVPHLPSEILLMIMEHLPASFFQQDIRRLAISRRWFNLAVPIFYSRIEFTPRVISRLVHLKPAALEKARARLRKALRCANIVLNANTTAGEHGRRPAVAAGGGDDPMTALLAAPQAAAAADAACWNTASNLVRLALLLRELPALAAVRFTAGWSNPAWLADPLRPDYLGLASLDPYLGRLPHVTSLDLDLRGTNVVDDKGEPVHLCSYVRPLLARLRALRLRARSLCPVALAPPDADGPGGGGGGEPSPLYLGRVSEHNPKLNVMRRCFDWPRWWTMSAQDVRKAMRSLASRMPEPRRAELVHLAPSGEVHVWDATTDACVRDRSEPVSEVPGWCGMDPKQPCFYEDEDENFVEWSGDVAVLPTPEESDGELESGLMM